MASITENAASAYNQGNAFKKAGRLEEALACYDTALKAQADFVLAHYNRGNTLQALGRWEDAVSSYDKALELEPDYAAVFSNRGNALLKLGRIDEAVTSYDQAIALKPDYAVAHANRAAALMESQKLVEALESLDRSIELEPDLVEAHLKRGVALHQLHREQAAVEAFNRVIALEPKAVGAYVNRGEALRVMGYLAQAVESFDAAIALEPEANIFFVRGLALQRMGKHAQALVSFDEVLRLDPEHHFVRGDRLHLKMQLCQWEGLAQELSELTEGVSHGRPMADPFPLLALVDSPDLLLDAARIFADRVCPVQVTSPEFVMRSPHGRKLKIGYYSADFHNHATTYLMAQLFEFHDRERFELYGFSFGPDVQDAMRVRIAKSFDHFMDVQDQSDLDVARLSRELEIDIALDLKGYTGSSRTGIFAYRCAPIQINYLGYPGTMGAPYIDYIVADATLIGPEDVEHYSEKVIWLPDSYQVNDRQRVIAEREFTRAECGLPEQGFVFCCFNNNYKILPEVFDVWMRLLVRVPDSVLWLLADNDMVVANLRREAQARGVEAHRLVFGQRMSLPEHLARHRLADLFVDTWPCNAHTTASDALWAGLPVLTLSGRSLASRVAASLLKAVGLPGLIAQSVQEYEDMAVALAQEPQRSRALRDKLQSQRLQAPLFDCERFTRHLERAYEQAMAYHWAGEGPRHFAVVVSQ